MSPCRFLLFFRLYSPELIGCDGSSYSLCLSASHLCGASGPSCFSRWPEFLFRGLCHRSSQPGALPWQWLLRLHLRGLRQSGDSPPCCAGWSEQHRQPRYGENNGQSSQQDWVDGLKIEPAELSCVQLEQPEGINVLLQQQAVEGASSCGDQQWCGGDRYQPAMDAPSLPSVWSGGFHCLRSCWWSSRSSVQGIQRPLFL